MEALNNGIQAFYTALRKDPYMLESAYISVIAFANSVRRIVPLTEISEFWLPVSFNATGGQANLGKALQTVAEYADRDVVKSTCEVKGDYRPMVIIMTAGLLSDIKQFELGLQAFNTKKWGLVLTCAAGPYANQAVLHRITEHVVNLEGVDAMSFTSLFRWDDDVEVSSISSRLIGDDEMLPPPPSVIAFS